MNMRRDIARRDTVVAVGVALLLAISSVVPAQTGPAEDQRMMPYAQPGQLVDIGGRRINMLCAGSGSPTVVLMAGIFSWSLVWYKTQSEMAQKTRVCAFDRAAFGFSDPAPRPQLVSDVVDDLHAVLKGGSIPGPYVLVGHSLGGLEVRVYAQRWPQDVVGMVLVDTAHAAEGLIDESQPGFDDVDPEESYTADMLHCASLARRGAFEPASADFKFCSATLPNDTPAAFRKVWPQFFTAPYFEDKASLMASVYTHRYDGADHQRLGAMPLVVLTADNSFDNDTPAGIRFWQIHKKEWYARDEALAHLSSRGTHRLIKESRHHIQLDQPQAVINAVDEVVRQVRGAAHP